MWILILVIMATDYHSGSSVATAEFNNKAACDNAAAAFLKTQRKEPFMPALSTICAPKE